MSAPGEHPSSRPVIHLERVSKTFAMGEVSVQALRDVSMEVYEGELLVMVGPSGSGKTSMVNIFGGLDTATSGRVCFRGRAETQDV